MCLSAERTWSPGSLPGDLFSHPDRSLTDHLEGTTSMALELARRFHIPIDISLLEGAAMTHDLEKANPLFQSYLLGRSRTGVNHACPSSCFSLHLTGSLWATEAVRRHHTHMVNAKDSKQFWIAREDSLSEIQGHMSSVIPSWRRWMSQEDWEDFIDTLWEPAVSEGDWLTLRSLLSLLVTADRMDAIGVRSLLEEPFPAFSPIDFSVRKPTSVDHWRSEVHDECLQSSRGITSPGLYTLTLPTGAGKTVTGLEIAYEIASRNGCKSIVYALPFISIIEQNSSVAKELFGIESVQEDHSQMISGKEGPDDDYVYSPWDKMSVLFRYWRSPVILTTMVQLWNSIYDPRANSSMDFHRLSRSVVIMDEPQGIPPKFWSGMGKTLDFLSEKLGTYFILMTATQPQIGEGIEISPKRYHFPNVRHRYKVLKEKFPLDDLPDLLFENLPVAKGSGLVVLNTRKSAIRTYNLLKERLEGDVYFLSAWMTPIHRRKVLKRIKQAQLSGEPHYLISTQVVEAGVDLDFDWVFRDMGPLDSVVQVAGRCNRHGDPSRMGKVLVAEIIAENKVPYCSYVYDDVLLERSRRILRDRGDFDERDIPQIVQAYYGEIMDGISFSPVWEKLQKGLWGPDEKEELIPRDFKGFKVFVELDQDIRDILSRLRDDKWTLESLDEKKRLAKIAQQYSIEVPIEELKQWRGELPRFLTEDDIPPLGPFLGDDSWFLTSAAVGDIYDDQVGFVPVSLWGGGDGGALFL